MLMKCFGCELELHLFSFFFQTKRYGIHICADDSFTWEPLIDKWGKGAIIYFLRLRIAVDYP